MHIMHSKHVKQENFHIVCYMHGIKNFQLNFLSKVTAKGLHLKSRVSHQVAVDEKSLGYDLT